MVFMSVTSIFYQYCNKSFIWAKSTIYQILLYPELWGFKTQVFETTLSDHFGQTLHLDHDLPEQMNLQSSL